MLFAYQPENLIATAIAAVVAGAAIPVFSRLGFSSLIFGGLGVASGILVVAASAIRAWIADTLDSRTRRREPVEPPESFPDKEGGPAE